MIDLLEEVASSSILSLWLIITVSACIGSFLNVVIYRLPIMMQRQWKLDASEYLELPAPKLDPERFNLAYPDSTCPKCQNKIKPWFNIPVLGWLMLKGKCYDCDLPISFRYPFVEALTASLCVLLYYAYGPTIALLAMLIFTYVCVALTGIDYDHQLLPDVLVLPLLWLGLILNTQQVFVPLDHAVLGAAAGYGVLWSIFWVFKLITKKDGMGYGDFKLMACFGAWFGWQILPNIILLSSLVGAVLGLLLIVFKGERFSTANAFWPFYYHRWLVDCGIP